jgi:hypothetical protein
LFQASEVGMTIKSWLCGLAIALLYLGIANAALSMSATSCTDGAADALSGIVLSIALEVPAFIVVAIFRLQRDTLVILALALLGALWEAWFALRLAYAATTGGTACAVIEGNSGWLPDGREGSFATLWLVGTALPLVTMSLAALRARNAP